jgi:branched-chain amino acid transport system substrate-binding protein
VTLLLSRRALLPALGLCLPRSGHSQTTIPYLKSAIALGLVWSGDSEGLLTQGVQLARDEINRDGGVLGHQINLVEREIDPARENPRVEAVEIARGLCQHGDLLAIIGHHSAEEAIPAAVTYDEYGKIFINPRVTRRTLNDCGFQRTFTTVPSDRTIAEQIATFAFGLGYRRFIVLRSREDFAQDVTIAFADQVARLGMTIVDEQSFTARHTNFADVVADLGAKQFDAILIVARTNQTAALIRQSYAVRLEVPFLIGGFAPVTTLIEKIGKGKTPISVPILFNPQSSFGPAIEFRRNFMARYGVEPDDWAAQGYDAVRLLQAAIKTADSIDASSVATLMRYAMSWKGLTGRYSFDRAGRIYTKQLKFATIDQGAVLHHDVDE